jgi:hypothetical protein
MEAYQFNLYSVLYSHSFEIVLFDLILFSAKDFYEAAHSASIIAD